MTVRPVPGHPDPEWLRRKERGSVAAIKLIVTIALGLGRPAIRVFLPAICLYFLLFWSEPRRASRLYLARALKRPAALLDIFRHYRAFASCVLDRVFFLKNKIDLFDIRVFDEHLATAAQAMRTVASPELISLLNQSGLGSNPEVIRHFLKIAPAYSVSKWVTGGRPPAPDKTAGQVLYPNMNTNA